MKFLERIFETELLRPVAGKLPTLKQTLFSLFGIALLCYLFVILLSYNPADPAWSHVGNAMQTTNLGGRLGAWIADILHVFFGLSSWLFLLFLVYELVRLWWVKTALVWPMRVVAYAGLVVLFGAFVSYVTSISYPESAAHMGGMIGFEIWSSLSGLLGTSLAVVFLVVLILLITALTFEIRWKALLLGLFGWADHRADDDTNDQTSTQTIEMPQVQDKTGDEEIDDYTPHNHDGAFASFLVHSGLRDEILADKQAKEQAEATTVLAETVPLATDVSRHQKIAEQAVQAASFSYDERDVDEPSVSEVVLADEPEWSDVWVNQAMDNEPSQDKLAQDMPSQSASQPKSDVWQATNTTQSAWSADEMDDDVSDVQEHLDDEPVMPSPARSHAMDTLSYRLSLSPIPELSLLDKPDLNKKPSYTPEQLAQMSELLEIKLQEFNIKAEVVSAMVGPVVTRFEVELAPGVKASRVSRIAQDLARSMSKTSLRVVEIVPNKPYIGIEVPNEKREMVRLIELLDTPDYQDNDNQIAIAVGKDIGGKPVIADLAKAPHMLVAGTTGSGKSVLVNSFLLSMLLKYTPDELKLVLIDPKQLELANYGDIPHLLTPVITDMNDAVAALTWCVTEMERRYQLMAKLKVRKISEFNKKLAQAESRNEPIYDPLWKASDSVSQSKPPKLKPLPLIVVVADEFADMIMQLGKTAEDPIVRLAQKARAAGIHLLLATQRPTVNVVTGLIKANVPARVALRVNSKVDSRTIIEEGGAEDMLGHGDMMFIGPGKNSPERVHGAYVDDDEVNRICDAWRERGRPDYIDLSSSYTFEGEGSGDARSVGAGVDDLYDEAVALVLETRKTSTSFIQRKLGVGYNRAARIVEQMEEQGLLSAADNSGKRQILM